MNTTDTPMVWHYAPWTALQAIAQTGCLKVNKTTAADKASLLWFSKNQEWEATATKRIETPHGVLQLTHEQHIELLGRARFGLPANDPRLLDFGGAMNAVGADRHGRMTAESLAQFNGGDTKQWFATTTPVPLGALTFQVWRSWGSTPRHWRHAGTPQEVANHLAQVRKQGGSI